MEHALANVGHALAKAGYGRVGVCRGVYRE